MSIAALALSDASARIATRLAADLPACEAHLHEAVAGGFAGRRFARTADRMAGLWPRVDGFVCVMPAGVVVRAAAPLLDHKTRDPAVVCVDARARWAVSLIAGHEGGANALAHAVANVLGAEPVVTTATEAEKTVIVGVGCRRGVAAEQVIAAVDAALEEVGLARGDVRTLASVDVKRDEEGLLAAAAALGAPIRFLPADEIRSSTRDFAATPVAERRLDIPAVAEPAALLAGRRTSFLLRKTIREGVTVAIAREGSTS